ncbi:MAG: zf-HC2 domain-containing protein [Casimicrobiaceae bacterium]
MATSPFDPKRLARLTNCKEASRLLSQALEKPLSLGDSIRLRLHLHWCEVCRRVRRQFRFLHAAMHRYSE